jgi:hypothetical protein
MIIADADEEVNEDGTRIPERGGERGTRTIRGRHDED